MNFDTPIGLVLGAFIFVAFAVYGVWAVLNIIWIEVTGYPIVDWYTRKVYPDLLLNESEPPGPDPGPPVMENPVDTEKPTGRLNSIRGAKT